VCVCVYVCIYIYMYVCKYIVPMSDGIRVYGNELEVWILMILIDTQLHAQYAYDCVCIYIYVCMDVYIYISVE